MSGRPFGKRSAEPNKTQPLEPTTPPFHARSVPVLRPGTPTLPESLRARIQHHLPPQSRPSSVSNSAAPLTPPNNSPASSSSSQEQNDNLGEWSFDEALVLPEILVSLVQAGLTACEIGMLHENVLYHRDRVFECAVTEMVDAGTPYAEIGRTVLCNLDLRNDQDYPLYKDVEVGDPNERPRSSQLHRVRDPLVSPTANDEDGGPPRSNSSLSSASVHVHPKPINVVRWPFFKDEDDLERFTKGDDPEDKINSQACPEPRSKRGEMSLRQVPRASRFYEHLDESLPSEQQPTIARHSSFEDLHRGKLRKRR